MLEGPSRRAYLDALSIRPFRRLFVGTGLSGLGDGCGYIAVPWLALELAGPTGRAYAVGLSLAAFALPGAIVAVLAARRLGSMDARRLLIADGAIRLVPLGCVPILHAVDALPMWAYLALLAISSLLSSVGQGAAVGVVATHVAPDRRFVANSLMVSTQMLTLTLVGPALGGLLVATLRAPAVIGIDAASFGALLWAAIRLPRAPAVEPAAARPVRLRDVLRRPLIAWLLMLTVVFYGLYGPFKTALPLFVRSDLDGGAQMYGFLWTVFGVGALTGGLAAGLRGSIRRVEPFALAVMAGWGAAVLLIAATRLPAVVTVGMLIAGAVYAPYPAVTRTALQRVLPPEEVVVGAAGWFALVRVVTDSAVVIAGPIVAVAGARATMLGSGAATVATVALISAWTLRSRSEREVAD
jgi:predicted MFS family arabinose efflux permease